MLPRKIAHPNGTVLSTTSTHVAHSGETLAQPSHPSWNGVLRQPTPAELADVYALEAASYPADEAATEEKLRFRLAEAPLYFRAMYAASSTELIGRNFATRLPDPLYSTVTILLLASTAW